jgi:hypothetical protein
MADLSGRCFCGEVRWTYAGPVTRKLVCHCTDCQRATSSPFTAFIGLKPELLQWSGEINHFESAPGTFRGFCPACGTRLYFRSDKWPGEIHVHAATLDEPASYKPDAQVVMRSRASWLDKLDEVPAYQDFHADPKTASSPPGSHGEQ